MEEHLKHLEEVLTILKKTQLHLNLEKSEFGKDSVIYLGHRLSTAGLEPEATKVEVIRNWPQPVNIRELRSFLGLASYYRKFVPRFSIVARPLSRLTSKNVPYSWDTACMTAFQALKDALVSYPVLRIADPKLTFVVTTDASQYGIGAVLQQDDGDGLRPLKYYSKRMPSVKFDWPSMKGTAEKFVAECQVCQRIKPCRQKSMGLLTPLPILDGPGESVSVDFTDMGKASKNGYSQVMVIVDRFSKFLNLIPLPPHAPTELVIHEFQQEYIRQFGTPKTLVSDRDPRFISTEWKDFTSQLGIKLCMTSGRHTEANGLAAEINQTVFRLLRALIIPDQETWDEELYSVKGLYNNSVHSARGVSGDIEMASGVGDLEDRGRGNGLLESKGTGDFPVSVNDLREGVEAEVMGGGVVAGGVLDAPDEGGGGGNGTMVGIEGLVDMAVGVEEVGGGVLLEAAVEEGVVCAVEVGVVCTVEVGVVCTVGFGVVCAVVTTVMEGVVPSSVVTRSHKDDTLAFMSSREAVTEVWKVLSAWRMAERSGVAVFAGGCSPARLRAMLSTESVRMSDMLVEDAAMSGEEGVEDVA
ncbi:hypothetical protein CBR_g22309 [Chara braunii]|uniref:Integrase catalytic domain-containing protein n=1 Tax=Chara braunii TaxID=69332 RepID=A0A388L2N6_CHABU|nr:hypothetical protein CBR_g22309 [Chara braunii]|eukprot:GBG76561.1 hypothetical protein CBR_g22309 [Chara braunii]